MDRVVASLCVDIRALVRDLTAGGGHVGPSVYDTAQVLRLHPAASEGRQVVDWLIEQQSPDGGWGDPAAPRTRDVPTLAAVLAIHAHASTSADRAVVTRGVDFLRGHAGVWAGPLPNALPVAIEVLLPYLLRQARRVGLDVPIQPYRGLVALGQRRLHALGTRSVGPGTPPAHSWEAFGDLADPRLLDDRGSVGNSPAATAAWLRNARQAGQPTTRGEAAGGDYLEEAAAATGTGIRGVVPTVWPIERFEQSFGLYALLIGGLLEHPALRDETNRQIDLLHMAMRPTGLGMSDEFIPDGDDTAAALAVLASAGRTADLGLLEQFAGNGHYVAYVGELQPSVSVSARAAHALAVHNPSSTRGHAHLIAGQRSDGRWSDDKWHGSWLYATLHVLVALLGTPSQHHPAVRRAIRVLLAEQRGDGGWGSDADALTRSNSEETAFGVLGLRTLARHGLGSGETLAALQRGERWMQSAYRRSNASDDRRWLGKESYRPGRVVRIFELAATFPSAEILTGAQAAGGSSQTRARTFDAIGPQTAAAISCLLKRDGRASHFAGGESADGVVELDGDAFAGPAGDGAGGAVEVERAGGVGDADSVADAEGGQHGQRAVGGGLGAAAGDCVGEGGQFVVEGAGGDEVGQRGQVDAWWERLAGGCVGDGVELPAGWGGAVAA